MDISKADDWLTEDAPRSNVVVSSRARYARNLAGHPFAPRSKASELSTICQEIGEAISRTREISDFQPVKFAEMSNHERHYLKESHLISAELEKGGEGRMGFFSPDCQRSILINEEDHLRLQCLKAGFRLAEALEELNDLDSLLHRSLRFAFSRRFGYLTACPTNTGTGLRVSVMLNLPGMVMTNTVEDIMQYMPQQGMTVRGFYGENSEYLGDFFQISNEVTLGKDEGRIREELERVVEQVIQREENARASLFEEKRVMAEDKIWKSYGALTHSRMLSSRDALTLLSRLRLGIDQGLFANLTHHELSRLMIEVQPAHLQHNTNSLIGEEARDIARATSLRRRLQDIRGDKSG
jgi:protein arginine kinase